MNAYTTATILLTLFAYGCSSSQMPTPPPAVLAISGSGAVLVGQSITLTVTANGASATGATWSSESPAVATVDAAGKVTGIANGVATITASYQGVTVRQSIRSIENYAGTAHGGATVTSCTADVPWWCSGASGTIHVGRSLNVTMDYQQSLTMVTGQFSIESLTFHVSGSVDDQGQLSFADSTGTSPGTPAVTFTLSGFRGRVVSGTFNATLVEHSTVGADGREPEENQTIELSLTIPIQRS